MWRGINIGLSVLEGWAFEIRVSAFISYNAFHSAASQIKAVSLFRSVLSGSHWAAESSEAGTPSTPLILSVLVGAGMAWIPSGFYGFGLTRWAVRKTPMWGNLVILCWNFSYRAWYADFGMTKLSFVMADCCFLNGINVFHVRNVFVLSRRSSFLTPVEDCEGHKNQ